MNPRIETISPRKLAGIRLTMSFANYKVAELWKSFMPRRKEIINNLNHELVSLTIYKPRHFENFKPANEFEKWATVEVRDFDLIPKEMEAFTLTGGLYAVFEYKGLNTDNSIYQNIFNTWLPSSGYALDDRPHFEILGEKYKNNDPNSEEEICIPIRIA